MPSHDTPSFLKHLNNLSVVVLTNLLCGSFFLLASGNCAHVDQVKFEVHIAGGASFLSTIHMVNLIGNKFLLGVIVLPHYWQLSTCRFMFFCK